jgi:hypothetical protein
MSSRVDATRTLVRIPPAGSRLLLAAGLCLGLSILYQIYIYDFSEGVLTGGERPRLLLKLTSVALFLLAIRNYVSVRVFSLNFLLKLPLLFIALTIVAIAPFLTNEYIQAVNLLFFMPLLFIDWNRPGGAELYRRIWALIVFIVVVQMLLDPVLKWYLQVGWSNAALVGGMGNPNVFGIFMVAAGLASAILLQQRFAWISTILFLATVLTGSLASALVGFTCALVQLVRLIIRSPLRTLLPAALLVALLPLSTLAMALLTDATAVTHAFNKLVALSELLGGGSGGGSESISVRMDYTQRGLNMIGEAPLAVITGHPQGRAMYSGDGMWVALLVTYGLPLTLYFLAVNLLVIYRAIRTGGRDLLFSACIVATTLAFLVTNRILDYWPTALIYLLAFSHLTTRGFRARDAAPPEGTGA